MLSSYPIPLERPLTGVISLGWESKYFRNKLGFLTLNNPLESVEFLSHPTLKVVDWSHLTWMGK